MLMGLGGLRERVHFRNRHTQLGLVHRELQILKMPRAGLGVVGD
jgi:hypothetical protein